MLVIDLIQLKLAIIIFMFLLTFIFALSSFHLLQLLTPIAINCGTSLCTGTATVSSFIVLIHYVVLGWSFKTVQESVTKLTELISNNLSTNPVL